MAGVFHKAMVWLGLAPDDEYDDYPYDPNMRSGPGPAPRPGPPGRGPRPPHPGQAPGPGGRPRPPRPAPRPGEYPEEGFVSPRQPPPRRQPPSGTVRQLPHEGGQSADYPVQGYDDGDRPAVRPMRPTSAKPAVLTPQSFDHAKEIADRFKADQPVVMDLSSVERDVARRLIDFASGICYALGGGMERIRPGGYLLTPVNVEVSDDERRRLAGR